MSKKSSLELQALALSELKTHRSEKWRSFPEDVLPLPVAEMDFPVAEPIRRILREMVDASDLGYLGPIPEIGRAFSGFAERRWGWKADAAQVRIAADVGVGIVEILRVITNPGDKVMINSPIYPNFYTWCSETKLEQVDVPYSQSGTEIDGSHWILDWDGIEKAYASGIKAHLISNPHNPLGKVFTRDELARFADLAKKYGVLVLSDEIHAPLTYNEQSFTPFLAVSDAAREVGITITSSSKGWNIAGLKCAIIITENEQLHEKLKAIAPATHYRASLLGGFASVAAFEEGLIAHVGEDLTATEEAAMQLVVLDVAGRKVQEISTQSLMGNNQLQISLASLNKGLYFIQAIQGNEVKPIGKVTKQ